MTANSKIVLGDSRNSASYPDTKYHLTVTSPPYYVGKDYEQDYSFADYKDLLRTVFHETAKRTVDGGKIAINIADIAAFSKVSGRVEENIEISRDIVEWLRADDCYLLSRIAWVKDPPWINSQHVGYNEKIPATYVRVLPSWEYVWVYYKKEPSRPDLEGLKLPDVVSKEDWKRWAIGVWNIRSVQSNASHEAMFPEELVRRLVLLYSVRGDTVFDPFMGSGTTAVVAYKNGRNYAGIERSPEYHALAQKGLENVSNTLESEFTRPTHFKQNKVF